ncbi:MAG: metallophosphoesterase [Akkermansia sp.]
MRRVLISLLFTCLLIAGAGGMLWWGVCASRELRTEQVVLELPQWPDDGRSFRAVVIADWHLTAGQGECARQLVEVVRALKPDVLFSLGDYPNGFTAGAALPREETERVLAPLLRDIPCYYVIGNHDDGRRAPRLHLLGAQQCHATVHRHHFDAQHPLDIGGYLTAHGGPLRPLWKDAASAAEVPRIILSHYPSSFWKYAPDAADAIFCGHTHGGQLCAPGGYTRERWRGGWHRAAGGQRLYIARGVGCSILPFRLFCPPELTLVELRGCRRP